MKSRKIAAVSLIFFVVFCSSLWGADETEFEPIRSKWMGPYPRPDIEPPVPPPVNQVQVRQPLDAQSVAKPEGSMAVQSGRVAILVETGIYSTISNSLSTYATDLASVGFTTTTVTVSGNAVFVRGVLQDLYNEPESLVGAVLIGDIPYIIYELDEDFVCDFFYMDMDGTWLDNDTNGKYDEWNDSNGVEIWTSRMKTNNLNETGMSETNLLITYFQRNHALRRNVLNNNYTALAYPDDDWQGMGSGDRTNLEKLYGSANVTMINDPASTTAADYMNNQMPAAYRFVHTRSHGWHYGHGYYNSSDVYQTVDVPDYLSIDPVASFYSLFVCSGSAFNFSNSLGHITVFNPEGNGLLSVGSTKTGGMLYDSHFYDRIEAGDCMGEAFRYWFNQENVQNYPGSDEWFWGMVLVGDGSLSSMAAFDDPMLTNHWKLDESGGLVASDSAGGFDGTLNNGPTWQTGGGQIDGALLFDGIDDYVNLGSYDILNVAMEFTISFWIKPAQVPFNKNEGIIGIGTSSQRAPWIWGENGSSILYMQFETIAGGTSDGDLQLGSVVQGQWTHIVVCWDGATCSSYINGAFDNSDGTTGNTLAYSDGTNYLGRIDGYGSWDGLLDDIRVYNYSLSEEEIAEIYRQGRPSDLDRDGDVDLLDLNLLGGQYLLYNGHTESGGLVVMEAEHFTDNIPGSGSMVGSSWTEMTGSGSVGAGFMQALPDQGRSINSNLETYSPHLSYQINFSTTGDYYLWVRGMAADSYADTVHYGADKVAFSCDYNSAFVFPIFAGFSWSSQRGDYTRPVITIDSPGIHNLDFWMREDGAALDRIVLTTDIGYNPSSGGEPSESEYLKLTADFNADGVINLADYAAQASAWLEGVE